MAAAATLPPERLMRLDAAIAEAVQQQRAAFEQDSRLLRSKKLAAETDDRYRLMGRRGMGTARLD